MKCRYIIKKYSNFVRQLSKERIESRDLRRHGDDYSIYCHI